jgi:hypothetical protein
MNITILEDVMSCILQFVYRHFGETYSFHLHEREKTEASHFFITSVKNQITHRYIQEDINRLNKKRINTVTTIC